VQNTDVRNISAGAGRVDRLHHRFLRADALQHRVSAEAFGQFLNARDAFVTAFGDDVGGPKLTGELLPRIVSAHRDNAPRSHLFGREHAKKADGSVADNNDGATGFYLGGIGGEPARS
jgi:hypothetical protein